ncbi:MAG: amidohydrolase family protein [Myxococcota bacterium]
MLIADCEVERDDGARVRVDVEIAGGRIARITARASARGSREGGAERDARASRAASDAEPERDACDAPRVLDARGGALLPALHDHHLHLLALAAARASVVCGPPGVRSREPLGRALRAAASGGREVRGVAYHESVAGDLDRDALDALAPGARVRVQHRTGALWTWSSALLEATGLAAGPPAGGWPEGAELDARGRPTGRFFRLDDWLAARREAAGLARPGDAPSLADASRALARAGVASATDATPRNDAATARLLAAAFARGELLQRVRLMGGPALDALLADGCDERAEHAGQTSAPRGARDAQRGARADADAAADVDGPAIEIGERKLVLDERALPSPDALARAVEAAHEAGRAVAVHCVTRVELALAASAIAQAGARAGDRIEHASVAPPDLVAWLAEQGVAVVTQPGFVRERGDAYLRDVDPVDRAWLYRCAGLDAAGVSLGGGTDAPYGAPDPWLAMQAAVDRRTEAGALLGRREAVTPERALALFTTSPDAPGGAPRRIAPGAPADLVLLDRPWARARETLSADLVRATFARGRRIA